MMLYISMYGNFYDKIHKIRVAVDRSFDLYHISLVT